MKSIPNYSCGFKPLNFDSEVGTTFYYSFGNPINEAVVLIPGFLCSAVVFNKIINELKKKDLYIITYDPFGTGGSVLQSCNKYDLNLYVNQLDSLIKSLNIKKLSIIGFSMGCIIASKFCMLNKNMVDKMIFLGPAGIKVQLGPNKIVKIIKTWLIGKLYMNYVFQTGILDCIKTNYYNPEKSKSQEDINHLYLMMYSNWLQNPNFADSACSILGYFPFEGYHSLFKELDCEIQVILGENDKTIPLNDNKNFWESLSNVKVKVLKNCGHWFLFEKYNDTIEIIKSRLGLK